MGKGKSKESAAQERANLLGINPIANHASGTFMTQHSHAALQSRGSISPLHENGILDKISAGYKTVKKTVGDAVRNSEFNRSTRIGSSGQGTGSIIDQRSGQNYLFGTPDKTVTEKIATATGKIKAKINKKEKDKFWNQPDVKNYLAER